MKGVGGYGKRSSKDEIAYLGRAHAGVLTEGEGEETYSVVLTPSCCLCVLGKLLDLSWSPCLLRTLSVQIRYYYK